MPGRDGIAGLVCLAISVLLLLLTRGLPPPIMVPIGAGFYPRVVLSFMALLSVLLIAIDWRARRRARAAAPAPSIASAQSIRSGEAAARGASPSPARANYLLVLATFVVFALYVVLLPLLGFRVATLLFVAGLQVTLEWPHSWRRWLLVALVAIATTLACDLAFERYLSVLLPRGQWTGM